jgi:hypothetical protein
VRIRITVVRYTGNEKNGQAPLMQNNREVTQFCSRFATWKRKSLVHIAEGARARAARIAARSACTRWRCRRGRSLRRDGKDRKLRLKFLRVALRALSFFFAIHQRLELVMALLADILKNRHKSCPTLRIRVANKRCGEHAYSQLNMTSEVTSRRDCSALPASERYPS